MHLRLLSTVAILLALTGSARAVEPARIKDPDQFTNQIVTQVNKYKFHDAATQAANGVGHPEQAEVLEKSLKELDGKTFDFGKKVYDKDYAGALRQIVYYSYFKDFGFVYFRFTFKMTSTGWLFTNFYFKEATQELFPKEFLEEPK